MRSKKTTNQRRGRPRAIADANETARMLVELGKVQATRRECCAVLNVSESTLARFFKRWPNVKEAYEEAHLLGQVSLRRSQFKLAEKSALMAIHLGKLRLGQTSSGPVAPQDQDPKAALSRLMNALVFPSDKTH